MRGACLTGWLAFFCLLVGPSIFGALPGFKPLPAFLPRALPQLVPQGDLPATNQLRLSLGLPLHHRDQLNVLLNQLYDPRSTNFHQFLKPDDFINRFGPTEQEYQAVVQFATDQGLTVVGRHRNRLVLDLAGNSSAVERTFQVHFRTYQHPKESRTFFAPDAAPCVPTNLPVNDIWGLSDYARPKPAAVIANNARLYPQTYNGTGPGGSYLGRDFRNAYAHGSLLNGAGQTVALVEFDGYYPADISNYEVQCGYSLVPLQNVYVDSVDGTPGFSGIGNAVLEVSLDIEMAIAMAPGLSKVLVYEGASPYDVYNSIATDDLALQIGSSWTVGAGPSADFTGSGGTLDSILSEMAAQGQGFFQAAGDSDAYTGSQTLNGSSGPIPEDSIYVTSVGGTSLSMSNNSTEYATESVWNWGGNTGTGGGISTNYLIPSWQAPVSMAANNGSSTYRNIPDVAMAAEAVDVVYNNGSTLVVGGTSCAAPLWAGFCALLNQQAVGTTPGGSGAGFLNPAIYAIGTGSNYATCFNDVTNGNNTGANTPGLFNAVPGYDLCTGWGSPAGTNLINALAPLARPFFITQPLGLNVVAGSNATLSAAVSGASPIGFQWQFNGVNLSDGGNLSGSESNNLFLSAVPTNQAGDYTLVLTNAYGSVTSSIAILQIGFSPVLTVQPTNLAVLSGGTAIFGATAAGSSPLAYLWQENGSKIVRGQMTSGLTSNLLTLSTVSTNDDGNYSLLVTNIYGAVTSSVASLFVYQLPAITASSLTNRTVECASNELNFTIAVTGAPTPAVQWSLDGVLAPSATNTVFSVTNLELPAHIVSVMVTNAYGSLTNTATITVQDTIPPVISLIGPNPLYVELGGAFADPGATANDLCTGPVPVFVSGSINPNVVSTNSLVYSASDASSNSATATRIVIVRDTTPPTILASFTNLTLAASSNCTVPMPNVTGTNYIAATDLSPPLVFSQFPTNQSNLPVGTNVVVIAVADAYGNTAYSTNTIVVQDDTPPAILTPPSSQTNIIGASASFSVVATACTPETYQWARNAVPLAGATNATLILSNLTLALAGNYSVLVAAAGGTSTSAVAALAVNLIPATGTLVSSENPSGFHDNLSFAEGVIPTNATGTIQFFTNGSAINLATLVSGQVVSTNLSGLPRGTNLITAVYSGDTNDLAFTNILLQVVTNHPPVALPAFYSRAAGASLIIPVTNLSAKWSDVDGDSVSLAGVNPSTNGVTVLNPGSGFLTYSNANNVSDRFTCTITDGFGGTNYQPVSIAVVFPGIGVVPANNPGIGITLNLTGLPGQTYVLETTTNLTPPAMWLPVATNTVNTNGVWQFNDTGFTNFTQRFYRLSSQP